MVSQSVAKHTAIDLLLSYLDTSQPIFVCSMKLNSGLPKGYAKTGKCSKEFKTDLKSYFIRPSEFRK